jgi:hypothetical protein
MVLGRWVKKPTMILPGLFVFTLAPHSSRVSYKTRASRTTRKPSRLGFRSGATSSRRALSWRHRRHRDSPAPFVWLEGPRLEFGQRRTKLDS